MAAPTESAPIVNPKLAAASFERAIRSLLEDPALYARQGVRLLEYRYPVLDLELTWERRAQVLRLRVDASDFNYRPIKGWWIGADGSAVVGGQGLLPSGKGFHTASRADGRPGAWFCFPGWSEWHDHNGHHREKTWASLRIDPSFAPLALIMQLHSSLQHTEVTVA